MAIQNGFIQIIQDEKRDYQYEEAMKTLRTNIQFSGNGLKVIMLTSAMPDEGKSETSFQLAISMAQTEGRVLFIDADIRKSVLVSRFGGGQQIYGLTQYLTGQRPLGEVLYHTNLPNLDIIFSGPMAPTPAERGREMSTTRSSSIRRRSEVSLTVRSSHSAATARSC